MDLNALIKNNSRRPVKDNSVKSYITCLRKLNGGKEIENLDFLKDKKKITDMISDLALTTRKNYISSVNIVLAADGTNPLLLRQYREELDNLTTEFNEQLATRSKTDKQERNWVSIEFLKDRTEDARKTWIADIENKMLLQDYLIALLYTELPPARLDYANMKIVESEYEMSNKDENYLLKTGNGYHFILNEYKSSKKYGTLRYPAPDRVKKVINMWLLENHTPHFLIDNRGNRLKENYLSNHISRIFSTPEKHIYLNLIRSIVVSETIDFEAINKANNLAARMGHSPSTQQNTYYKK